MRVTRSLEEILEQEPKARARVEALRQAIKDADGLGNEQLSDGLQLQFKNAIDEHVSIFMEAIELPFDEYYSVVKAMEAAA
jgi:hypothetical protein